VRRLRSESGKVGEAITAGTSRRHRLALSAPPMPLALGVARWGRLRAASLV
jgi:hypothetical protein